MTADKIIDELEGKRPYCKGKVVYLGSCRNNGSTIPTHTLMCIDCKWVWDIDANIERLQEAWKIICAREEATE